MSQSSLQYPSINYVDLKLYNNNKVPTLESEFQLTSSNSTLINKLEDHEASVVRFSLDISEIPLYICPIDGSDANTTPFTVTLNNNGDVSSASVQWVAEYVDEPVPTSFSPQDVSTRYYFLKTYNHLIQLFNIALASAYSGLSSPPVGSEAPYFQINWETKSIELVAQANYYDNASGSVSGANLIEVYLNQDAYRICSFFSGEIKDEVTASGDDQYFKFSIGNLGNNVFYPTPAVPTRPNDYVSGSYYIMHQNKSSLPHINSLSKIVITTQNMPINNETTTAPTPYGSAITSNTNGSTERQSYESVLTDFVLDPAQRLGGGSTLVYEPTSEYRMLNLQNAQSLKSIQLRFSWEDFYGNLRPIYLARNTGASVKIMFRPKQINRTDFYQGIEILSRELSLK